MERTVEITKRGVTTNGLNYCSFRITSAFKNNEYVVFLPGLARTALTCETEDAIEATAARCVERYNAETGGTYGSYFAPAKATTLECNEGVKNTVSFHAAGKISTGGASGSYYYHVLALSRGYLIFLPNLPQCGACYTASDTGHGQIAENLYRASYGRPTFAPSPAVSSPPAPIVPQFPDGWWQHGASLKPFSSGECAMPNNLHYHAYKGEFLGAYTVVFPAMPSLGAGVAMTAEQIPVVAQRMVDAGFTENVAPPAPKPSVADVEKALEWRSLATWLLALPLDDELTSYEPIVAQYLKATFGTAYVGWGGDYCVIGPLPSHALPPIITQFHNLTQEHDSYSPRWLLKNLLRIAEKAEWDITEGIAV